MKKTTYSIWGKTEYYRDDDHDSGYGDNPQVAVWYGPNAPDEPPEWFPLSARRAPDEFDLMCERKHDSIYDYMP